MKKSKIAKIITYTLDILLIVGTVLIIFIPSLYDYFKGTNIKSFNEHLLIYQITFILCYLIGLIILYKLRKLFNDIYKDTPFKKEIETNLKMIAILFMILFIIGIIKCIFISTLLSLIVSIVCFLVSLSFYVIAEIIKSAIEYKKEVDFTI